MTAAEQPADPMREFRQALPPWLRAQVHDTQRVAAAVVKAVSLGWTIEQLVAECSRDLAGIHNAGGLATYRLLQRCEGPPPPGQRPPRPRPAWCGVCDEQTRHVEERDAEGLFIVDVHRCPDCHPLTQPREVTA